MGKRPASTINHVPKDVFKTGSVHHSPEGLVLMGSVDGKPCNVTVDTGSNISIVLTEETRNSLQSSNQMLRTITGEMAPIRGCGELRMGVGGLVVPHEMWVAEITDEYMHMYVLPYRHKSAWRGVVRAARQQ